MLKFLRLFNFVKQFFTGCISPFIPSSSALDFDKFTFRDQPQSHCHRATIRDKFSLFVVGPKLQ